MLDNEFNLDKLALTYGSVFVIICILLCEIEKLKQFWV